MRKRRFLSFMSLALVATMAIAGCSGSSGSGTANLTVVGGTDIQSLDIHKVSDSPSFSALEHVNETLFHIQTDGSLKPLLAESYSATADGKTVTIKLRKDVKFTDGEPFNAAAVVTNIKRVKSPETKSAFGFLLGEIADIVAKDELTVELQLKNPFAPLQAVLGHGFTGMISPKLLAQGDAALATTTIGTGPFTVKEWKKGEAVVLTRNDNYWGKKASVAELTFKMVKEDGPRMLEAQSGNADVAVRVPPTDIERLKADKNLNIETTPGLRTMFIYMNVTKAPLDNVKVRQAINYAVDNDAIVNQVLNGMGRVSDSVIAPAIFGYAKQTPYKADKAKAKQLLKEAGYENGFTVELLHPVGRYPQDAKIAEAIALQLKDVGITVKLTTMEWAQYIPHTGKPVNENTVQMAMLAWSTPTMDADYGIYSLLHSSAHAPAGFNRGFYKNDQVDKLLADARQTIDAKKRQALYGDAQKIIWADAPWIFLQSEIQVTAIRKNVKGFQVHPSERLIGTGATK